MIAEFEARILALIDVMVEHASDDELFASGYLRGHLTLAVAELEESEAHSADALYRNVTQSLETAISAPVYPELFMLGGLGSRGLCTAPLSAEVLAAQMSNEPLPLDRETLAALNPNRLWVRKLLKGKAVK